MCCVHQCNKNITAISFFYLLQKKKMLLLGRKHFLMSSRRTGHMALYRNSCLLYPVRSSMMAIQTSWSVSELLYGQEPEGTCCSEPQKSFRSLFDCRCRKEVAFPVFCDELLFLPTAWGSTPIFNITVLNKVLAHPSLKLFTGSMHGKDDVYTTNLPVTMFYMLVFPS